MASPSGVVQDKPKHQHQQDHGDNAVSKDRSAETNAFTKELQNGCLCGNFLRTNGFIRRIEEIGCEDHLPHAQSNDKRWQSNICDQKAIDKAAQRTGRKAKQN